MREDKSLIRQLTPMQDSRKWRERAEEYRVLADRAHSEKGRQAFLSLAETYDDLARHEEHRIGVPSPRYYLTRAEECVHLAAAARTDDARQLFAQLEKRWRKLAEQARGGAAA
jgi:hypothetical protein